MRRSKLCGALAAASTLALVAGLGLSGGAAVADPPDGTPPGQATKHDIRHVGPDYNNGKRLPFKEKATAKALRQ